MPMVASSDQFNRRPPHAHSVVVDDCTRESLVLVADTSIDLNSLLLVAHGEPDDSERQRPPRMPFCPR
jgi:hypothetical protein